VSRALGLAFDNKDLAILSTLKEVESIDRVASDRVYRVETESPKKDTEFKLKINSQQHISLDEKNDFSS